MEKSSLLLMNSCLILVAMFLAAQANAGSEAMLFVPKNYAPLSSFQKTNSTAPTTLQFSVPQKILSYVIDNKFSNWIALQNSAGKVTLLPPTSLDATNGRVTFLSTAPGKYVFVADPFTNDYPIVTHWRQALNSGRGGFQAGASDPIGTLDYIPGAPMGSETTDILDNDPLSPYTFNVSKYALFSADPLEPSAKVPSIDRYVLPNRMKRLGSLCPKLFTKANSQGLVLIE